MARTVTVHPQSGCCLLVSTHAGVAPGVCQVEVLDNQLNKTPFLSHFVLAVWFQHLPVLPPLDRAHRLAQLALQRGRPALGGFLVLQLLFETDWQG